MPRDPKSRDLTLNSLALLTGGLTAAAFVGTGWVTGLASDYTAQKAHAKAVAMAASAPAVVAAQPVVTPRPVRTVVTTRYVQAGPGIVQGGTSGRTTSQTTTGGAAPARAGSPARAAAPAPVPVKARAAAPAPSAAS